jgi:hypothetical protein
MACENSFSFRNRIFLDFVHLFIFKKCHSGSRPGGVPVLGEMVGRHVLDLAL